VGGRKDANVGRMFVLEAGRNDVVRFKVNVIRGRGEFRDGCGAS
jgi:hypothetical protein